MPKQIIPVVGVFYDETDFVEDWIRCVLSQRTDEVVAVPIVVTNHHHVESDRIAYEVERLRKETERTIELVPLNSNKGHSHAFNRGIECVESGFTDAEWIASLDPDARLGKNSIQLMLNRSRRVKSCGMVTPIVFRCEKDQAALEQSWTGRAETEPTVLHAGHFPCRASIDEDNFPIYWKSLFMGRSVSYAIKHAAASEPFTPCFCAGLWSTRMIGKLGPVDEHQFRTLNCGEFGYRANLRGFCCVLASDACAFHPKDCSAFWKTSAFDEDAEKNPKGNAWHFQHGQALIALKYFPDSRRMTCMKSNQRGTEWLDYFDCLKDIKSELANEERERFFNALPK